MPVQRLDHRGEPVERMPPADRQADDAARLAADPGDQLVLAQPDPQRDLLPVAAKQVCGHANAERVLFARNGGKDNRHVGRVRVGTGGTLI